jgi:hypothetical protein
VENDILTRLDGKLVGGVEIYTESQYNSLNPYGSTGIFVNELYEQSIYPFDIVDGNLGKLVNKL